MLNIWSSQYLLPALERANENTSTLQLDDLPDQMMDLVIETCQISPRLQAGIAT